MACWPAVIKFTIIEFILQLSTTRTAASPVHKYDALMSLYDNILKFVPVFVFTLHRECEDNGR